ncbi:MAG: zinc-ribbon domain containing protein [Terriglobia bacterium]
MEFQDKVLFCVDCGAEFVFTAGEQMFFADKGFKHEPKRCKPCKSKRKQNHNSNNYQRVESVVICSQCGRETTVPFKPTQGRPVYCRDCYQHRRAAGADATAVV